MTASSTVKETGEVIEVSWETAEDLIAQLRLVNDTIKSYESIKKKLQDAAHDFVNDKGIYEHEGYLLRVSMIQRMSYDPSVLREVFEDEDLYNSFLEPQKGRIDKYIKENLETLGEGATRLRKTMIAVGAPYSTVRLEKL